MRKGEAREEMGTIIIIMMIMIMIIIIISSSSSLAHPAVTRHQ